MYLSSLSKAKGILASLLNGSTEQGASLAHSLSLVVDSAISAGLSVGAAGRLFGAFWDSKAAFC
ncbi:MAG: hypothetical protein IPO07_31705 [Haliscomenobacter sp.]|nr:hypothetical protein [Haliscomenobacter sp.]MBK9492841.1 hypothetical protein [Haliscomenobacter sp.]